jgi:hypothetical protein
MCRCALAQREREHAHLATAPDAWVAGAALAAVAFFVAVIVLAQ